jgi:hypothetical protein
MPPPCPGRQRVRALTPPARARPADTGPSVTHIVPQLRVEPGIHHHRRQRDISRIFGAPLTRLHRHGCRTADTHADTHLAFRHGASASQLPAMIEP